MFAGENAPENGNDVWIFFKKHTNSQTHIFLHPDLPPLTDDFSSEISENLAVDKGPTAISNWHVSTSM